MWCAFAELQRECGISILDLQKFVSLAKAGTGNKSGLLLPFYELRGFMWAGLLDESQNITLKEVGKILDNCFLERSKEIAESLANAIMQCTFFKEAKKKMITKTSVKKKTGAKKTTSKKVTT